MNSVSDNYRQTDLFDVIVSGLEASGVAPSDATVDDLAPVDEFHVGGREATAELLAQLGIAVNDRVLDVGCGIGGAARYTASTFGCSVVGIDITAEYIRAGTALNEITGLSDRIRLRQADVIDTALDAASFDAAYLLHVGMNVADKRELAARVFAALKPGGVFGVYDLMRTGDGEPAFPVPWSLTEATSWLAAPAAYRDALTAAGFDIVGERNRRDFAVDATARMQARLDEAGGPPPLGLHLLMGPSAPQRYRNMVEAILAGVIAPVEIVTRKPA